ncbi:hypothetical protein NQ314_000771 [Rhamnusium bicolor]|uniref:GCVT N-terminal domain-containing protein n=1 Tax=Rhamnusium bicolor TaxID=1586634 RepID=A0AAV8ZTS5_9CUCU|nr:hypothetical protein NQ314_000771 [Rhamnusium bicolor]
MHDQRMFSFGRFTNLHVIKRLYSFKIPTRIVLEELKERSLIRVTGQDVTDYLQGLITNDIHHLSQRSGGSMYTMFLNTKGRILYDAIIYKTNDSNTYLVECDKKAIEPIQKHLKIYRVRRKVDINSLDGEYTIHTLFNIDNLNVDKGTDSKQDNLEGIIVPCDTLNGTLPESSTSIKTYKDLLIFKDPRVVELGSRIISKVGANVKEQIKEMLNIVELPEESKKL